MRNRILCSGAKYFDQDTLNKTLKYLYYTDYFKEVEISFDNQIINIKVVQRIF